MGGVHHPVIGVFGVMSAKMTAVNFMVLTSAIGFMFYRRANKVATVSYALQLNLLQAGIFAGVAAYVLYLGIDGYFVQNEEVTHEKICYPVSLCADFNRWSIRR
jgi:hypothetical protein